MTLVVLVILAALWAVVLLPPLLRSRSERSNDSIGDFNHRLDVLGRTNGALRTSSALRVSPARRAAKRRRDVTRTLLATMVVTGLGALATNLALAWMLFAGSLVAFAAFCALWAWVRSVQVGRARKVRTLPRHVRDFDLRRAASS